MSITALFFDDEQTLIEGQELMAKITLEELGHSYVPEPQTRGGLGAEAL